MSVSINQLHKKENTATAALLATPIALQGALVTELGVPVDSATVHFVDDDSVVVTTNVDGQFSFAATQRRNRLLVITATGFRTEHIAVHLLQPQTTSTVDIGQIVLSPVLAGETRFLFGGDTGLGRRWLDVDGSTPLNEIPSDDPEALIQASDPLPGSKRVFQWVKPLYLEADWGVVNLETPVTDNPSTPHTTKAFVFYTLPGSLPALTDMGVDYVSLGNNHLYDYLEQGVTDTIGNIEAVGLEHSGGGMNSAEAFTANRQTLNGTNYSLFSGTTIRGETHADTYVADDTKGGAANLYQTADVVAAITGEVAAGYSLIAQYHTGFEYAFEGPESVVNRMKYAVDNGAALVIGHHPHVTQGVGYYNGKLTVHSLGNFAFDQDRQETLLGMMARVDMAGDSVNRARMLPVYLKDYRPRLISGDLANRFLRRIGEFSTDYGAIVYPYLGQGWVAWAGNEAVPLDRSVSIDITIPASGDTVVDLRQLMPSEASLMMVATASSVSVTLGRDLMDHGDFEDWDTDANVLEASRWGLTGDSKFLCTTDAYRGVAALCSTRTAENFSDSVITYRNRVRVFGDALDLPNKNLTLFGYIRGDNAGQLSLIARYYGSLGSQTFGEEVAYTHVGGTFTWQPFIAHLSMPDDTNPAVPGKELGAVNARATRLSIQHSPPATDIGMALFDDFALINWDEQEASLSTSISTPHGKDFLMVKGTPGTVTLDLSFRTYVPTSIP